MARRSNSPAPSSPCCICWHSTSAVVSREHLSQEVLGKRLTPFDRAIDMHISNLRRKLPERKDGHPWFKTLRGRGYLMVSAS